MLRITQLFALCVLAALAMIPAAAGQSTSLRVQVVDERGLPVRDAVVELKPAGRWTGSVRFPWRMAMAQKNETFVPGTLVIAKGSTVAFPNLDRVRHSIYSFSKPARFEIELYGRDQTRSHRFPITGSVKLGCNIHDDMRGYIRVTDTPFAGKTDHNGYITLRGMPPGTGKLTVWHPQLRSPGGELNSNVSVKGSGGTERIKVRLR